MSKHEFQINVAVDFTQGRGFGNMGLGLPSNFLTGEPTKVCATIAALYMNPDATKTNKYSQAMTFLALYASGAHVCLDKQQFRQLERVVREYQSIMRASQYEHTMNASFAGYVLKRAVKRAKQHKTI
jgi:hypothetical protein